MATRWWLHVCAPDWQSGGQTPFFKEGFHILQGPYLKKGSDPIEVAERVLLMTCFEKMSDKQV